MAHSQSQTDFLEDVLSWDAIARQEQLKEAVPRLIKCMKDSQLAEEEIGILKILCQSFLPEVGLEDVEELVFSSLSPLVTKVQTQLLATVHQCLSSASSTLCGRQAEVASNLELLLGLLDCVKECVQNVLVRSGLIPFACIRSLPGCVLHLLTATYSHCKESSQLYGELLGALSEALSRVFRSAYSLQMVFLKMLDKVIIDTEAAEEDIADLCTVCMGCFSLCSLVTALDLKLSISLWKAISRLAGQYAPVLAGHLPVAEMVAYLSHEIGTGLDYLIHLVPDGELLSPGDVKTLTKLTRVLNFQLRVLINLVKEFPQVLDSCVTCLYQTVIKIYSCLSSDLETVTLSKLADLVHQVPALVGLLLNQPLFIALVVPAVRDKVTEALPLLLLQVTVVHLLLTVTDSRPLEWLFATEVTRGNILEVMLCQADHCYPEMALPMGLSEVPTAASCHRVESLYHYICTHLCSLIAVWPAHLFSSLEQSLLSCILSGGDVESQLAADCWCFLARHEPPESCLHQVIVLFTLVAELVLLEGEMIMTFTTSSIVLLLSRLIKFLTSEHQKQLVIKFPPAETPAVWVVAGLSHLMPDVQKEVAGGLLSKAISLLREGPLQLTRPELLLATQCMVASRDCLSNGWLETLAPLVGELWWKLEGISEGIDGLPVCWLLQLTEPLVHIMTPGHLLAMLTVVKRTWMPCDPFPCMVVGLVAQRFAVVRMPSTQEQLALLQNIADVFLKLLTFQNALVHHCGLTAFAEFAETTVHESLVPDCLQAVLHVQGSIFDYINKVPAMTLERKHCIAYLQSGHVAYRNWISGVPSTTDLEGKVEESQWPAKRLRVTSREGSQSPVATKWQLSLDELLAAVSRLTALRQEEAAPKWIVQAIREVAVRLQAFDEPTLDT